jgi:hypothetical protein
MQPGTGCPEPTMSHRATIECPDPRTGLAPIARRVALAYPWWAMSILILILAALVNDVPPDPYAGTAPTGSHP